MGNDNNDDNDNDDNDDDDNNDNDDDNDNDGDGDGGGSTGDDSCGDGWQQRRQWQRRDGRWRDRIQQRLDGNGRR
jgi:hypothetical protein